MHSGLFEVNRLEAFSDAVLAIIITITVLELRFPASTDFSALIPVIPTFLAYLLSFVFLAIYWNNHHHLLKVAPGVNASVMWSNMALLFFLSLTPFFTAWMGHFNTKVAPTASYGVILAGAAVSYYLLQQNILRLIPRESPFRVAIGKNYKGKVSPLLYIASVALAFVSPYIAQAIFVVVALIWIVPDRRIERAVLSAKSNQQQRSS
jgi:uncharacterized membrane protein